MFESFDFQQMISAFIVSEDDVKEKEAKRERKERRERKARRQKTTGEEEKKA